MTARELLADLRARGVELKSSGGLLLYRPRSAVDALTKARLSAYKHELLLLCSRLPRTQERPPRANDKTDKSPSGCFVSAAVGAFAAELDTLLAVVGDIERRQGLRYQHQEDASVAEHNGLPHEKAERLALRETRLAVAGLPRGLNVPLVDAVLTVFPGARLATPSECERLGLSERSRLD